MNAAAENFHQRVKDYAKANAGMMFVIHAKPEPQDRVREDASRKAWFAYLSVNGLTGTLSTWQFILNGSGKAITVPCEKPEWFDPYYVAPVGGYRDPSEPSQRPRVDVSRVVQRTMASLRAAVPKGRQPVPADHLREPEKTPAEWLAEYQANPPPIPVLSDEAKEKFGIRPPITPEAAA